jgi:hypothetical protein
MDVYEVLERMHNSIDLEHSPKADSLTFTVGMSETVSVRAKKNRS